MAEVEHMGAETRVRTKHDGPEVLDELSLPNVDEDQVRALDQRYMNENTLLDAIAAGDLDRVRAESKRLVTFEGLHRNQDTTRDRKNALIVLNTLMRKKIEEVGIRPYFIDAISSRWGLRIEQTSDPQELRILPTIMAEDYCRTVKSYVLGGYSPHVRAALEHIHMHLADEELSLSSIAAALRMNPTYLSHQFNETVGMSVPEYVARIAHRPRANHDEAQQRGERCFGGARRGVFRSCLFLAAV